METTLEALADDLRNRAEEGSVFDVAVETIPLAHGVRHDLEGPLVGLGEYDGERGEFEIRALVGTPGRVIVTTTSESGSHREVTETDATADAVLALLYRTSWGLVVLDEAEYPCGGCGEIVRDGVACHDGEGCDDGHLVDCPSDADKPAAHTPGPWSAPDGVARTGGVSVRAHGGRTVVIVLDGCDGSRDADARLIAAAPDLLEACRALELHADDLTGEYGASMLACLDRMRDAIAKATGVDR